MDSAASHLGSHAHPIPVSGDRRAWRRRMRGALLLSAGFFTLEVAGGIFSRSLALLADAAQINTFQPPASPENPLLEEFYYISVNEPTTHFRHGRFANTLFCDGHVQPLSPVAGSIDTRLPAARVGQLGQEVFQK